MLYESNELIYFHVIKPEKVSYVFKAKPAQDFGDVFVSCILFSRKMFKAEVLKVPISWLGVLHIYNILNPVIRIAIYLVVRKCYLRGLFGC